MTRLVYDCTMPNGGETKTVKTWAEAKAIKEKGGSYEKRYEDINEILLHLCKTPDGVIIETQSIFTALKAQRYYDATIERKFIYI